MPDVKVYIRKDDFELWKALENKTQAVSDMLNSKKSTGSTGGTKVRGVGTVGTGGSLEKVDKRNPDVQMVVDTWLQEVGPPDGTQAENRRFAKLLIQKHGLERSVGAVKAVKPSRSLRFNPSITSIKDLYYKFGKLEEAYSREKKEKEDPQRELTQEELNRELGL